MKAKNVKLGLDTYLEVLYHALRYRRCRLVAIEFEHRGKKYRADTAREAAELQALLDRQDVEHGRERLKLWSADTTLDFMQSLGEMQKAFLETLSEGGNVDSETMIKALRLDSELALAGVISGLSKQARNMEINPHDLYVVESEWNGKKRERSFRLLESFRESLLEIGWPEAWKEEKQPK